MKFLFKNLSPLLLLSSLLLMSRALLAHQFENGGVDGADGRTSLVAIDVGPSPFGLAIDAGGAAHVCFIDASHHNRLTHADSENDWQTDAIEANLSNNDECAIVASRDGTLHVVYTDKASRQLKHAVGLAGQWNTSVIDGRFQPSVNPTMTRHFSMGVSPNEEKVGVAYHDGAGEDLKYAEYANGEWRFETLVADGDQGTWPSLGFSRNNKAIVSYVKNFRTTPELWLIEEAGGRWHRPALLDRDGAVGTFNTLVVDASDRVHIGYHADAVDGNQELCYLLRDERGLWENAGNVSTRQWNWLNANAVRLAVDDEGNAFFLSNWEFVSALFPDVSSLEMISSYFSPQLGGERAIRAVDTVAFNALRSFAFEETAIAIDADHNGYVAWVEDGPDDTFPLHIKVIGRWWPAVALLSPNEQDREPNEERFTFRWLDFDPDSDAHLRLSWVDEGGDFHVFAEGLHEDEQNHASISLEALPDGSVPIVLEISDADDFSDGLSRSWAPSDLLTRPAAGEAAGGRGRARDNDPIAADGEARGEKGKRDQENTGGGRKEGDEESAEDDEDGNGNGDEEEGTPGDDPGETATEEELEQRARSALASTIMSCQLQPGGGREALPSQRGAGILIFLATVCLAAMRRGSSS